MFVGIENNAYICGVSDNKYRCNMPVICRFCGIYIIHFVTKQQWHSGEKYEIAQRNS